MNETSWIKKYNCLSWVSQLQYLYAALQKSPGIKGMLHGYRSFASKPLPFPAKKKEEKKQAEGKGNCQ